MRLIGNVKNEKLAFHFYSLLLGEGIHCTYEIDKTDPKKGVLIWVYEEDQIERAEAILEEFKANPNDPKFSQTQFPEAPPVPPDHIAEPKKPEEEKKRTWKPQPRKIKKHPLTSLVIFTCIFLYIITFFQQINLVQKDGELALKVGMVPIQQALMFDYPEANQKMDQLLTKYSLKGYKTLEELPPVEKRAFEEAAKIPTWQGIIANLFYKIKKVTPPLAINGPMFVKIREGEVWRLFTPVLLHGNLLHILFNMIWVWILLPAVEARLPKWKVLLFILLTGILPCIAQYLVSGPYFVGFSGVVVALVGFIWVRQKVAPWEGYPLQKMTIIFVFVYVAALFGLEIFALVKNIITTSTVSSNIGNTAHIAGGLLGMLFGTLPFFSRGIK